MQVPPAPAPPASANATFSPGSDDGVLSMHPKGGGEVDLPPPGRRSDGTAGNGAVYQQQQQQQQQHPLTPIPTPVGSGGQQRHHHQQHHHEALMKAAMAPAIERRRHAVTGTRGASDGWFQGDGAGGRPPPSALIQVARKKLRIRKLLF